MFPAVGTLSYKQIRCFPPFCQKPLALLQKKRPKKKTPPFLHHFKKAQLTIIDPTPFGVYVHIGPNPPPSTTLPKHHSSLARSPPQTATSSQHHPTTMAIPSFTRLSPQSGNDNDAIYAAADNRTTGLSLKLHSLTTFSLQRHGRRTPRCATVSLARIGGDTARCSGR